MNHINASLVQKNLINLIEVHRNFYCMPMTIVMKGIVTPHTNDGLRNMKRNKGVCESIVLERLIEMHINPHSKWFFIERENTK